MTRSLEEEEKEKRRNAEVKGEQGKGYHRDFVSRARAMDYLDREGGQGSDLLEAEWRVVTCRDGRNLCDE